MGLLKDKKSHIFQFLSTQAKTVFSEFEDMHAQNFRLRRAYIYPSVVIAKILLARLYIPVVIAKMLLYSLCMGKKRSTRVFTHLYSMFLKTTSNQKTIQKIVNVFEKHQPQNFLET